MATPPMAEIGWDIHQEDDRAVFLSHISAVSVECLILSCVRFKDSFKAIYRRYVFHRLHRGSETRLLVTFCVFGLTAYLLVQPCVPITCTESGNTELWSMIKKIMFVRLIIIERCQLYFIRSFSYRYFLLINFYYL